MSLDRHRCSRLFWKLLQVVPEVWLIEGNARSRVGGQMDLHVDVVERDYRSLRIALSHYWLHPDGELLPDPDIEIAVFTTECLAEALTFTNSFTYDEAYPYADEPPNLTVHQRINEYLEHWLDVLHAQGHVVQRDHFKGDSHEHARSHRVYHDRS